MQAVGKDQATESGDLKTIAGPLLLHVRQAKQQQRRGLAGAIFPVPFDGRDLRRLMLKGVKTMHIPHHRLDRRHQQRHPHRHRQHFADGRRVVAAQKMPRGRRPDEHGATEKRGYRHMEQAIRKRGVKDNRQPVLRDEMAIFDDKTLRRLHPAIGGKDPEGRNQRAKRHHAGGKKMQRWRHFIPAKQHHTEESRFKEEGGQHFVQQQRAGNTASELGKSAPVGAELIGHD
ncbi:Uncharacterised protein [Klebsiella pneumoniae]|nr:Uncharacterised protein [Klebsiella pneumoniae]